MQPLVNANATAVSGEEENEECAETAGEEHVEENSRCAWIAEARVQFDDEVEGECITEEGVVRPHADSGEESRGEEP